MADMSLADIATVTRNNNDGYGWGDGCGMWFWIIIILFLGWGNNGWGNRGNQDTLMSDEFIKRDIFNTNQNVSETGCKTQRDVLENRYTTQLGFSNLSAQNQACCLNFVGSLIRKSKKKIR